jgi:hypothetical protein
LTPKPPRGPSVELESSGLPSFNSEQPMRDLHKRPDFVHNA